MYCCLVRTRAGKVVPVRQLWRKRLRESLVLRIFALVLLGEAPEAMHASMPLGLKRPSGLFIWGRCRAVSYALHIPPASRHARLHKPARSRHAMCAPFQACSSLHLPRGGASRTAARLPALGSCVQGAHPARRGSIQWARAPRRCAPPAGTCAAGERLLGLNRSGLSAACVCIVPACVQP